MPGREGRRGEKVLEPGNKDGASLRIFVEKKKLLPRLKGGAFSRGEEAIVQNTSGGT